ncbi:MAG TPA: superoxide dismutase [Cu-Zn] SodC [Rhodopila sp.]
MKHPIATTLSLALLAAGVAAPALAADMTVRMLRATQEGTGDPLGTITLSDTEGGASFKLHLHGLPPGEHGFHVHENGNCGPTTMNEVRIPAGAAGGHLDPDHTNKHMGPAGGGHLGDLPVLAVAADGTADQTLVAPHIKEVAALKGHALMIHVGGDNYSDSPAALGGGGGRFACGIVE